jgi:Predicted transcriptional regulators
MDYKIARRIALSRQTSKMTQKDLADKLGIDRSQLARIETGNTNGITIGRIAEIAEILNVNPIWLSGWDNEPDTLSMDVSLLTSNERKQVKQYIDFLISSRE